MYTQTEYGLAYGLIFAFLLLGMLVVCIPRPRKKGFVDPAEAAKEKRMSQRQKAQAKSKKKSAKLKKKKMKAAKKKNM
jgi:hypothetical protein